MKEREREKSRIVDRQGIDLWLNTFFLCFCFFLYLFLFSLLFFLFSHAFSLLSFLFLSFFSFFFSSVCCSVCRCVHWLPQLKFVMSFPLLATLLVCMSWCVVTAKTSRFESISGFSFSAEPEMHFKLKDWSHYCAYSYQTRLYKVDYEALKMCRINTIVVSPN